MPQHLKEQLVDYDPDTGRVLHSPIHVFVELSSRCNLACVHCPKDFGIESDHPTLDMSLEVLRAATPWLQHARFVNLNMVGESLLCQHFDEALTICSHGKAEVSFNTNGLLLSEKRCDHIVASGVHSVTISIDGIESNNPIRGCEYETVRSRVIQLHEAKLRARSVTPHIAVAFTLMRRNADELPRITADLTGSVDLHAIHVQPLIIFYESLRDENPYKDSICAESAAAARRIAEAANCNFVLYRSTMADDERHNQSQPGQLGQSSARFGCIDPFYEIKIRSTGDIMGCSYGLMPKLRVQDLSMEAIWNHEWYRNLRQRLARKSFTNKCAKCPFVHGSAENQEDAVRHGVKHSRESRFFGGGYKSRRAAEDFIVDGDQSQGAANPANPAIDGR
jgi:MoaA/NifB/PqqE/SkfB family radical SAM enzyme